MGQGGDWAPPVTWLARLRGTTSCSGVGKLRYTTGMSGYRNMWFTTGGEHRAYLAFAAVRGRATDERDADNEELLDQWEGLDEIERKKWFTAAELVAYDATTDRG